MMLPISTEAIEALQLSAMQYGDMGFVHLCTSAIQGHKWALDRVQDAFVRLSAALSHVTPVNIDRKVCDPNREIYMRIMRETDTAHPGGGRPRSLGL